MARQTLSGVTNSRRTIEIQNIDEITKEHLVVFTAETAIRVKKKYQNKNMFPFSVNDYLTIVDRRHGHGKEYNVRPGGRITYQNNEANLEEVLNWIANKIVLMSPVGVKKQSDKGWRKTHYQDAHLYMVDGKSAQKINSSSRIVSFKRGFQHSKHTSKSKHQFVNTMVYARRIERGGVTTDNKYVKPWSMAAPSGVYKSIARAAKLRFGQTVRLDYKEMQLNIGARIYGGTKHAFNQFYPTIVVRARETTKL